MKTWLLSALLILAAFATPASATILFQTDFEDAVVPLDPSNFNLPGLQGAPAGWSLSRNSANNGRPFNGGGTGDECYFVSAGPDGPGLTTGPVHSGTKALKIQYFVNNQTQTSGVGECSFCLGNDCGLPSIATGVPDASEFWFRAWMYPHNYALNDAVPCPPNPDCGPVNTNKIIYFKTSGSSGYPDFLFQFVRSLEPGFVAQNSQDCYTGTTFLPNCFTTWGSAPAGQAAMVQDVWQCAEGHYKMNSITNGVANSDATIETWLNGQLVYGYGSAYGLPFRSRAGTVSTSNSSADAFFRGFQIYRQGARLGSVMYWDDIAIGDARIGCDVGTPPPPTWVFCANEDAQCVFTGTKIVRYGSGTTFVTLTKTGGTPCTNAVFGDPTPNVVKHCDIQSGSPPVPVTNVQIQFVP